MSSIKPIHKLSSSNTELDKPSKIIPEPEIKNRSPKPKIPSFEEKPKFSPREEIPKIPISEDKPVIKPVTSPTHSVIGWKPVSSVTSPTTEEKKIIENSGNTGNSGGNFRRSSTSIEEPKVDHKIEKIPRKRDSVSTTEELKLEKLSLEERVSFFYCIFINSVRPKQNITNFNL